MELQASYVGKTPEEYAGQEEYTLTITMTGEISIYATSKEEAFEIVKDMSKLDLLDYIDDTQIE